ncbi:hypothetical protein [Flavobacterium orientale]|uniref:Uncharacterized protein n=1 Tax=Flavobacterium orientale TaxID=1756020 RepID=A0A916YAT5_9FLAO|nr:hypothetical protein [Flavobacterium orientale]GGD36025.1 hypothetical protein GCM10011343_27360 [Flavobacterium orientale]
MKLIRFLALSDEEQYDTLFLKGNIVAVKKEQSVIKKLYTLSSFFVEVHFHHETNEIMYKKIFKDGELLDNYLKNIEIK